MVKQLYTVSNLLVIRHGLNCDTHVSLLIEEGLDLKFLLAIYIKEIENCSLNIHVIVAMSIFYKKNILLVITSNKRHCCLFHKVYKKNKNSIFVNDDTEEILMSNIYL